MSNQTSRTKFLFLYFAAWLPPAVLYAFLIYLQSNDRSVEGAIFGGLQSMLSAALLGLGVWSIARRMAERPRPVATLIAVHLGLAIVYTTVWTGLIVLTIALFAPPQVLRMFMQYALGWELLTGVLIYGLVAGISHAVATSKRLRREREAAARAETLRARAELSALRAQMNPHFLFNTLHSVAALVRADPVAAEQALERLATLLRRVLDVNRAGVDQIALGEEWDVVRDQLELEKLRYGDRLRVVTDIESDALECAVPLFALQPLVENAVRHGVAARTEPCTVAIGARIAGETLEIEVKDDGPGADRRATLSAVGLGLRSVRSRLLAMYGDRGGFHVETAPGEGFLVRLTLPAVVAERAGLVGMAGRGAAVHA